ncbi:Xanthine phosphoribosyltransferase 1 [Orbilia ellipsospora]|uniref:Xanthine phosphoribosyltransferase 1 n=1 Tax=Orbilia ellipsospora TaxID=2528407 RepID=A0AAV9XF09_9PEZI
MSWNQYTDKDAYQPFLSASRLFSLLRKPISLTLRRLSDNIPTPIRNIYSDYRPIPQALPLFYNEPSSSIRRGFVLLASLSTCCVLLFFSFLGYYTNTGRESPTWGRDDVSRLLGPSYPLGVIVSPFEWSTFSFGSRPIPAPPPEPPGTTVLEVVPPSEWIECPAAREYTRSLPEVTFVPLEEVIDRDEESNLSWLDEWITNGRLGTTTSSRPQAPTLDVIYTWVNGSSPAFKTAKDAVESKSRLWSIDGYHRDTMNRHHDWDELRYSMRSLERFLEKDETGQLKSPNPLGKISIVSTDHTDGAESAQAPLWLDISSSDSPEIIAQESLISPALQHTCAVDTFSSCSIEARLDRLQGNDKIIVLSDDMLLSNQHTAADIYSPLYGLPFTFDYGWSDFAIDYPPAFGSIEHTTGEMPYLFFSAYLLNIRFGWEGRSYTKHTLHPMSRSILRELRSTFPSAFELSSAQRFRGESPSIHLWFLFYWYVIERHRETLIWSYLYGKMQDDKTGNININDLRTRLNNIDTTTNFTRTSLLPESVTEAYKSAGIESNKAYQALWSSADGPVWLSQEPERDLAVRFDAKLGEKLPFDEARQLHPCEMEPKCFEFDDDSDNVPTNSIFEKWRRVERSCGDCMINALLRESGPTGLAAFLPENSHKRKIATRALHRYAYTVSRVDARYGMMDSVETIDSLSSEWIKDQPSEVCFNDHFLSQDPIEIAQFASRAKEFFEAYYPGKSKWEL